MENDRIGPYTLIEMVTQNSFICSFVHSFVHSLHEHVLKFWLFVGGIGVLHQFFQTPFVEMSHCTRSYPTIPSPALREL